MASSKSRHSGVTRTIVQPPALQPPQPQQISAGALGNAQPDDDDYHIANATDEANLMAVNAAYDRTMRAAQRFYIDPVVAANGYNNAQNMNHTLKNQGPQALTGAELQTYNQFMSNMAPIGANLILNRATHDGIINALLGGRNYQTLSDKQLNAALTGAVFMDNGFVSTAWDVARNPFVSGAVSGGREVYMNIKTPSWVRAVVGDKHEAELVIQPGMKYKITGAHYNGQMAYPQKSGAKKRIVVDVEIIP